VGARGSAKRRSSARGPQGPPGPSLIVQEVYGENQARPTTLTEPLPGGTFFDILTVPITTTVGTHLDIEAALGALATVVGGSPSGNFGIRVTVDGVSTGLGASVTLANTGFPVLVSFSMCPQVAVAAGVHSVVLQWYAEAAFDDSILQFVTADRDGCSMRVREVVP
jgi:hypothetical protein